MNEKLIDQLIEAELKKADAKWANYHDHHESYAIIKAEIEELSEELDQIVYFNTSVWDCIRNNRIDVIAQNLDWIKHHAKNAIKEAVQVYVTATRAERVYSEQKQTYSPEQVAQLLKAQIKKCVEQQQSGKLVSWTELIELK